MNSNNYRRKKYNYAAGFAVVNKLHSSFPLLSNLSCFLPWLKWRQPNFIFNTSTGIARYIGLPESAHHVLRLTPIFKMLLSTLKWMVRSNNDIKIWGQSSSLSCDLSLENWKLKNWSGKNISSHQGMCLAYMNYWV